MLTLLKGGYKNKVGKLESKDKTYLAMFFDLDDNRYEEIIEIHSYTDEALSKTLPVRQFVDLVRNPKQDVIIFSYLPGNTIPWDGYTMNHIKLMGKLMSDIHFELSKQKDVHLENGVKVQVGEAYQMKKYFSDKGVQDAMKEKLHLKLDVNFDEVIIILKSLFELDSQLLHLDLVRGNVLFGTKEELLKEDKNIFNSELSKKFLTIDSKLYLTGVIDFEKVAIGPRVLDIARTLSFLIVDSKYKSEEKIRKYFLNSGYDKRGLIKLPDIKLLEKLLEYFWLYDFFKFLYYSPYESLYLNEHYLRTVDVLLKRGLTLPH